MEEVNNLNYYLVVVRLKDSFESAMYSEYERYKYVFPNSCVKL